MAFTIYNLFKATLLIINAMAVLHPGRFLKQYGLDGRGGDGAGVKHQIAGFLNATRYMRVPLIVVNVLIVVVELIFG